MKCKDCWQIDVCKPPEDIMNIGCEFHSKTRPAESDVIEKVFAVVLEDNDDELRERGGG